MPNNHATVHEIEELTHQLADAKALSGMSPTDIAEARAKMELDILECLTPAGRNVSLTLVLSVRLASLHRRLRAVQEWRRLN
jgi:hypothetical protein